MLAGQISFCICFLSGSRFRSDPGVGWARSGGSLGGCLGAVNLRSARCSSRSTGLLGCKTAMAKEIKAKRAASTCRHVESRYFLCFTLRVPPLRFIILINREHHLPSGRQIA